MAPTRLSRSDVETVIFVPVTVIVLNSLANSNSAFHKSTQTSSRVGQTVRQNWKPMPSENTINISSTACTDKYSQECQTLTSETLEITNQTTTTVSPEAQSLASAALNNFGFNFPVSTSKPFLEPTCSKPLKRGCNFTDKETVDLIRIWASSRMQLKFKQCFRQIEVWESISNAMSKLGHSRTSLQCRNRVHYITDKIKHINKPLPKYDQDVFSHSYYNNYKVMSKVLDDLKETRSTGSSCTTDRRRNNISSGYGSDSCASASASDSSASKLKSNEPKKEFNASQPEFDRTSSSNDTSFDLDKSTNYATPVTDSCESKPDDQTQELIATNPVLESHPSSPPCTRSESDSSTGLVPPFFSTIDSSQKSESIEQEETSTTTHGQPKTKIRLCSELSILEGSNSKANEVSSSSSEQQGSSSSARILEDHSDQYQLGGNKAEFLKRRKRMDAVAVKLWKRTCSAALIGHHNLDFPEHEPREIRKSIGFLTTKPTP